MNRMNNPAFWDTMVHDTISDGVANRPLGSPLTKWKSVEDIEPVKTGWVSRIILVVFGISCLAITVAMAIYLGEIGWAEVFGDLKTYAEDVGSLIVVPILGAVCIWFCVKRRKK